MFTRVFFAAILAGIAAGLVLATLQHFRTTPLIIAAESFEGKSAHQHSPVKTPPAHREPGHNHATDHNEPQPTTKATTGHDHDPNAWAPKDGFERTFYSALSDVMIAIGFAFLLAAASLLTGVAITPLNGALWGLTAFAIFTLAPAAGLPPELPGMPAADLVSRQIWWWLCVISGAIGVGLIALKPKPLFILIAVAFIAAPHLIGAPQPVSHESAVPAHMIQSYVANALFILAITWVVVGTALGLILKSQNPAES